MDLTELQNQVAMLMEWKRQMESSSTFPLNIQQALMGRGFVAGLTPLTGIVKANGLNAATAIVGASESVYVASTNGGAVSRNVVVTNGIVTT